MDATPSSSRASEPTTPFPSFINTTAAALQFMPPLATTTPHQRLSLTQALTHAAREGNFATTRDLIDAGANPYAANQPAELSPLLQAARRGHVRVTQLLLAERLRRGLWGLDRHLRDGAVMREAEERGDVEMVMLLSMPPEDVLSAEDLARAREGRVKRDSVVSML